MRKVFGLIIFGLLTTVSAVVAMEDDGLSPIMREALRKAKQDREIYDKELRQLDRELDRDTPCPWEKDKVIVTLPEGLAAPRQSKDDDDASPKEGDAAAKRSLVLAVSAPAPTTQALMPSKRRGAVATADVTNALLLGDVE